MPNADYASETPTHVMFICGEGRVHFMPIQLTCITHGEDGIQLLTMVDGDAMGEVLKPGSKVRCVGPREMISELGKLG